jgi:hypothetical protein
MPLPFIESQALFEQGEIGIAETFSCLAAMLPDFLFLQGAPHPGGSILSFEVFQLKEVFGQHRFPLIKGMHIFFFLMNSERSPSLWTHTVHSKSCYETTERRGNTQENDDEANRPAPRCRMTRGVYAGKKCPKGSSFPAYMNKGRRRFLRQARCDDMPDAGKPFVGGLTCCCIA